MKVKSIVLLLVLFLSGCASSKCYNVYQADLNDKTDLSTFLLQFDIKEENIYAVDIQPNPAAAPAAPYVQQVTVPQGINPGAASGAVAFANISVQLFLNNSHKKKLQELANEKAAPMVQQFTKERLLQFVEEKLLNEISSQDHFAVVDQANKAKSSVPVPLLKIQPDIRFSSDLTRLQVKLNILIRFPKSTEPMYKNSFEYWSPVVGFEEKEKNRPSVWADNDGQLVTLYLAEGCKEVVDMFTYDLATIKASKEQSPPKYRTYLISNDQGQYIQRCYPVKIKEDRVWVKDLRGNIRSLYGKLERGEG